MLELIEKRNKHRQSLMKFNNLLNFVGILILIEFCIIEIVAYSVNVFMYRSVRY